MASESEILIQEIVKKVDDFVYDHNIFPNAVMLSVKHIIILTESDKKIIREALPTISCLIPLDNELTLDLPLPVLLPTIATKTQRERMIVLENRDL